MNKFIRNNFLAICITLSVIFAFTKKATIFQQDKPQMPQNVIVAVNQETNKSFIDYWKTHKIEVSKYQLTEDSVSVGEGSLTFMIDHVSGINETDSIQVLRTDFMGKIHKENYDYSAMTSVYLPLNLPLRPHALKVLNSVQEPAGNSFLSLSQIPKEYEIIVKNTFQKKIKEKFTMERVNLEDELWAKIRMNPKNLPTGEIEIIPSFAYWQSVRQSPDIYEAKATLTDYSGTEFTGRKLQLYNLDYPDLKRNLSIIFEGNFPFEIVGWKRVSDGKVAVGKR